MPISLKKGANAQQARNAYSPKYFCSALTGYYTASGKIAERGMLNQNADPCRVKPGIHQLVHDDINIRRRTISNGGVTTNLIPISLIPATFWDAVATMPVPDLTRAIQLGTLTMRGVTRTAYLELDVHSIVHESERTDHGTSQRLRTTWRMSLWMLRDDRGGADANVSTCYRFSNSHSATAAASSAGTAYDNAVYVAFDADLVVRSPGAVVGIPSAQQVSGQRPTAVENLEAALTELLVESEHSPCLEIDIYGQHLIAHGHALGGEFRSDELPLADYLRRQVVRVVLVASGEPENHERRRENQSCSLHHNHPPFELLTERTTTETTWLISMPPMASSPPTAEPPPTAVTLNLAEPHLVGWMYRRP